jgi:hypothetical protein
MNHLIIRGALLVPITAVVFACGPSDGSASDAGGQNGDGGITIDARPGTPDAAVLPDGSCGAQTEEIPLVEISDPPDLLIVLDKSGSMASNPEFPLPIPPTKWDLMKDAIENVTNMYQGSIRFGLSSFPSDASCGVSAGANVNVGLNNAGSINGWMGSNNPDGLTPAHLALQSAAAIYSGLPNNPAGQFVLFATDGLPNCGGNPPSEDTASDAETVAAVQTLKAQGIKTFVLGFGDPFGFGSVLDDAAIAGGVPKPGGPPHFYSATDANSLNTALQEIAGGIIVPTCSFAVTETPPDPDLVTVSINGTAIPRDSGHNNGWDYHPDAGTITFFGDACATVQGGEVNVSFVFGCPGPSVD